MKTVNQVGQALDRATLGGQQCVSNRQPLMSSAMQGLHDAIQREKQLIEELAVRLKPLLNQMPAEPPCEKEPQRAAPVLVEGIYLFTETVDEMAMRLRQLMNSLEI